MIQQIDAMTVTTTIRSMAAHDAGIGGPRVEINLSGASMGDPEMLRVIEAELHETGLDPSRVIFEITETAAIANIAQGLGKETVAEHVGNGETVELLRSLGVSHLQGFYLGEPRPLEGFLEELQQPLSCRL